METPETAKAKLKVYRRKVLSADDDAATAKHQLEQQQKRLDSLMNYQDECVKGFLSLPNNAFFYAQRRECKLLLSHLAQEVALQQERVESCYEHTRQCEQIAEAMNQQLRVYTEQVSQSETTEQVDAIPVIEPENDVPVHSNETRDDRYSWIHVEKKAR